MDSRRGSHETEPMHTYTYMCIHQCRYAPTRGHVDRRMYAYAVVVVVVSIASLRFSYHWHYRVPHPPERQGHLPPGGLHTRSLPHRDRAAGVWRLNPAKKTGDPRGEMPGPRASWIGSQQLELRSRLPRFPRDQAGGIDGSTRSVTRAATTVRPAP